MDYLFLGLLCLAALALGPIAFFSNLGHGRRLREAETALRATAQRLTELNAAFLVARASLDRVTARLAETEAPSTAIPSEVAPASPVAETEAPSAIGAVAETPIPAVAESAPVVAPSEPTPERPTATEEIPVTQEEPAIAAAAPLSPPARAAAAPKQSWEEALGARWTVWVGGVAIALGALLLVRYSIEQGFFGPGARIVLGLILAAALVAAGEYLRRREGAPASLRGVPVAYVPGVLTAAGTVAAFGSIYAAHALYGFIGPGVAFLALGATGLAAMLAAALHGPALAGLGLLGSLVAPLLVASDRPEPWPVVVYVAVVVAAAYWLARARHWLWLALSAAAGGGLWSVVLFLAACRT